MSPLRLTLFAITFYRCFCAAHESNDFPKIFPSISLNNVKPGHMELDPRFGHIFDTAFFQNYNGSRIAGGGWESEPHSRPYQVGISVPTANGASFCGGALLGRRTILTAAHCLDIWSGGLILVYVGAHNIPPTAGENALIAYSMEVLLHPGWNAQTVENDIGFVYLFSDIEERDNIKYIKPAANNSLTYLGSEVLVSGWGLAGDGHTSASPVLREVRSRIISNIACRLAYLGNVRRTHICMSGEEGRSTCRGDSGGPAVIDGELVGIVSFGSSLGCEVGWPPAFTRVTSYIDWINQNIEPPSVR